jgi:hypothetical protein
VLDSQAIAISKLGKTVDNSWLEIQPALPGTLLWKTQAIAQFIPAQAPAIGTTYTFSIPANHTHLDQSPVPAGKFATLASEPFRVITANPPNRWSADYTPSTGAWLIVFNDDVDPAAAAAFVSFSSNSGQHVAARLERATVKRAGYYADNYKPWAARFPNTTTPETSPESPVPNIIVATPLSPLPVGDGWKVAVLKGLPNQSANARIIEDSGYEIGKIEPFKVADIKPRVVADKPRKSCHRISCKPASTSRRARKISRPRPTGEKSNSPEISPTTTPTQSPSSLPSPPRAASHSAKR